MCKLSTNVIYNISFNGWWCRIKGYFLYIDGVTFFHTLALQAIYQLCHILYRTQVRLHSFRLYIILSISLWLLTFFEFLPSFLIGDVEYIPNDYHCQFAPTSIRESLTVYSVDFLFPFNVAVFCYIWTMCSIRRQTVALVTVNQRINIHRDIIILKRLMIFLTMVTIAAAPHVYLPIIYAITGHLPLWIVSLEWLLTSLAIVLVLIILLFISPHLKKLHVVKLVRTLMVTARQIE